MGRVFQCSLCLLLGLLFCSGSMVEETNDESRHIPSTGQLNSKTASYHRQQFRNALETIDEKSQFDVATPTTAVPIINPTTPTTTTPIVNPAPTNPTSPTTMTPITNPTPMNPPSPTMMTPITNPTPANPTSPATTTPATNPYQPPMTASPTSGQSWCIASSTASQTALQVGLDYACGYGGADCSAIQQGGSCYNPDTVHDHASYAYNQYYQKNPVPTSCDFGGTAMLTNTDPSTSTCQYPSASTGSSVPSTNPPGSTGSTGFGSEPPSYSGAASIQLRIPILIALACLIISSL